jgi:hypothetical protein
MTLNAKHVAAWWNYRTRHQSHVTPAEKQWLESGQHQPLSSTAGASIQQEDNATIKRVVMGRPSKL